VPPSPSIIGAHDKHDIFQRHDQHHGPEHQRQNAEHRRLRFHTAGHPKRLGMITNIV